jgi:hypothetical protein
MFGSDLIRLAVCGQSLTLKRRIKLPKVFVEAVVSLGIVPLA